MLKGIRGVFLYKKNVLVVFGVLTALTGCQTLGPDFARPEMTIAKDWVSDESSVLAVESAEFREWWTVFNDPLLNELINSAYQQNLDLQIAAVRILESRAQLGIATGQQYPQFQALGGGFTHNELSENAPNSSPLIDTRFGSYQMGFDAAWEMDVWGRFRRGVEAADANLLSTLANYDDILVSLTAEVAAVYVQIRTFEERLILAKQNEEIQQRSLHITEVRFNNGATTELDVTQARALLHNTKALVSALELGLRQSKNGLSILLGITPIELANQLSGPGAIPSAPADVAVGMPAQMLRRRPDVRRAELQASVQSALVGVAEADLYPSFTLLGSFGFASSSTGSSDFSNLFDSDSFTATVGPTFSWPILNYGRIKNNVRAQDARYQQSLINYKNTVLFAVREVEDAMVSFIKSREQADELQISVEASNRSVAISLIQYRDGVTDYTRVLNSQEFLVQQQDSYTAIRGDVARSLIALYKALGGGWQLRQDQDIVARSIKDEMNQRTDWGDLLDPEALDDKTRQVNSGSMRSPDW
jgi:NodT family efflux transporter outer membrane factor (OMF) lipoprotein